MNLKLTLLKDKSNATKKGFPIIITYRHNYKQKRISLKLYSQPEHWIWERQEPNPAHPDYITVMQHVVDLKKKIYELKQLQVINFDKIKLELLSIVNSEIQRKKEDFYAFTDELISELNDNGNYSNAAVYKTVKLQLKKYQEEVSFSDFTYNFLIGFVNQKKIQGLRPSSIHNYLRTLRAIYNQAVLRKGIPDTKPFTGVFKGLKVRSHAAAKKFLQIEDIRLLEKADLNNFKDFSRDLFLLQFYFGGQDLKDIYYLKYSSFSQDRVYFKRSKVTNGYVFDLAVPEKAKRILSKYTSESPEEDYIFPYRKDHTGYITLRRRFGRTLVDIQKELEITIKPLGGNLGIKVARHTFANIGKRKGIDEDMLRELMGHERDDVDNYYKDKYPAEMRDTAQLTIIDDL